MKKIAQEVIHSIFKIKMKKKILKKNFFEKKSAARDCKNVTQIYMSHYEVNYQNSRQRYASLNILVSANFFYFSHDHDQT